MSFRIEEKLNINKSNLGAFEKWIADREAKKIHPDRIIKSIYFDNESLDMHYESEEGVVPRKKIRIRNYISKENDNKTFFLEKKINSPEGRFKTSKKIFNHDYFLRNGFFEPGYGACKPKITIKYSRSYYKVFDVRVTIDQNIQYFKYNSKIKKNDENIVVEIKSQNLDIVSHIEKKLPFSRTRFSKYSRGVLQTKIT